MTQPVQIEAGHNSVAGDRLRSIVERYERLDEEVKALRGDQKDLMTEAESAGFDKKALRKLIAERKMDATERDEIESLLEVYRRALGEYVSTPLGAAAMERVG